MPYFSEMKPGITQYHFGSLKTQIDVNAYVLKNSNGLEVEVLNYGGIIRRLSLPDRAGQWENCVLGFDQISDYEEQSPYFGAIVGRFGNRIAHGKFMLDGTEYRLAKNHGVHHLHGGKKGFDKASNMSDKTAGTIGMTGTAGAVVGAGVLSKIKNKKESTKPNSNGPEPKKSKP